MKGWQSREREWDCDLALALLGQEPMWRLGRVTVKKWRSQVTLVGLGISVGTGTGVAVGEGVGGGVAGAGSLVAVKPGVGKGAVGVGEVSGVTVAV